MYTVRILCLVTFHNRSNTVTFTVFQRNPSIIIMRVCAVFIHLLMTSIMEVRDVCAFYHPSFRVCIHRRKMLFRDLTNHHDDMKLTLDLMDSSSPSDDQSITDIKYDDLMKEYNALQNELQYIYALEQRNEAQLGSFVSVEAQWMAQDEDDRIMLRKKKSVELRMEEILKSIRDQYPNEARRR